MQVRWILIDRELTRALVAIICSEEKYSCSSKQSTKFDENTKILFENVKKIYLQRDLAPLFPSRKSLAVPSLHQKNHGSSL